MTEQSSPLTGKHARGGGKGGRRPSRRTLLVLVVAAVLGVAGGAAAAVLSRSSTSSTAIIGAPNVSWARGVRAAPGFSLQDQNRQTVSLAALRGRPLIVTFIDPLCRNFCPLEAKVLNTVVGGLPATKRPAIIAVSVNRWGNARSNLLEDVEKWHLVPEWRWAIGRPAALAAVWRNYQIAVQATSKTIAGVTVHEIAHTEASYLIDGTGHERALFLWPFGAREVEQAITALDSA